MALSNYTAPRTVIELGNDNSLSVRGLNLEDISYLVQVHQGDVDNLVSAFRGAVGDAKTADGVAAAVQADGDKMVFSLIQQFPLLAANLIATAADEPEAWDAATKLPVPKQIEALIAIAKNTFEDVDGFKKFVGNVSAVLQSVAKQKPQVTKATKSTGTTD